MSDPADFDDFDDLPAISDNFGIAPLAPDQVSPWAAPETPLPPSPWATDPAPAPDFLNTRSEIPQQFTAADIKSTIAKLPSAQRRQAEQTVSMIEIFGRSMLQAGVSRSVIAAVGSWMDKHLATGKVPAERRTHVFDLRAFNLQDDPYAISFVNAMERTGASQSDLRKILGWYAEWEARQHNTTRQNRQPARPAAQQDFAAQDAADRAHAEAVLRDVWGQSYATSIRTINTYLDGLPAVEREEIESATLPSGGLQLNCPDVLEFFLAKATSGPSPLAAEIQALEQRMKLDRKAWFRDEQAQARLRALYQLRDGGK